MLEIKKYLFSYNEAAEILSISKRTVQRLCSDGKLSRIYLSKRNVKISIDNIIQFLENNEVTFKNEK
jgi:excisionase family DNA binding protein